MFLRSFLSKAAPAGYMAMSIPELFDELEQAISNLKYTIATSPQDEKFNETLHDLQASIKNILTLLDKKFHALIGEENSETSKRNKLIENIERKIKIILKTNIAAKLSEKTKERIKKLPSEITNHCQVLLISVQNDINKIAFFPTMAKNELIALIAEADAELPIFLLKKYIQGPIFKDKKEDQLISSADFLQTLNAEEKIKTYNYYCDNASMPVEQQSLIYKLVNRGMNEDAYQRKLISDQNDHELKKRMPAEMWVHTTQFLGDRDLAALARTCTLFRGIASGERARRSKIIRDYSKLLSTDNSKDSELLPGIGKFITLKEDIIVAANNSSFSVIKLEGTNGKPQELLRINMPPNDFGYDPAGDPQLALCGLTKSSKGQLIATIEQNHFSKSTIVRIWDLQATNKLRNSFTLPYYVENFALTEGGETFIFNKGSTLLFWDAKKGHELNYASNINGRLYILATSTKVITPHYFSKSHHSIAVWDKNGKHLFRLLKKDMDRVQKIGLLSDNLLAAYTRNKIYIWNLDSQQLMNEIDYNTGHINSEINDPIPLPNGKIAFPGLNGAKDDNPDYMYMSLAILDIASGQLDSNLDLPLASISHATITADGNIIILGRSTTDVRKLATVTFRFAELCPKQENTHDGEKVEEVTKPTLKL